MASNQIKNDIIALLTFMISKANEEDLEPSIKTKLLLQVIGSSGINLDENQLDQLLQDKDISSMIASNENGRIKLQSAPIAGIGDDSDQQEDEQDQSKEDPGMQDLDNMAGMDDGSVMPTSPDAMSALPVPTQDPTMQQPPMNQVPQGQPGPSQVSNMAKRALSRR